MNWHFANIEGPCGADLSLLSLFHWDQDDQFEFGKLVSKGLIVDLGGDHCFIQQGTISSFMLSLKGTVL